MSCRLCVCLLALVVLACAVEDPAAPEAPSPGGGVPGPASGMEQPGVGAPDMTGGQTGEGGGHVDACSAETWAGPNGPRVTAHCQSPIAPYSPRYCTCDTARCPRDANGMPDPACAIEVPFDNLRCSDTLFKVCGVRHNNWCDVAGLFSQRKTCWTQSDGTHLCQCPGSEQLTSSAEPVCFMAVNTACASDCESERGRCEHLPTTSGQASGLNQFRCECEEGVSGTSPAYFCEDALRRHCSPACQNTRGACWSVPDATGLGNTADCLCAGSTAFIHLEASQWDPQGEGCLAPLLQACGE